MMRIVRAIQNVFLIIGLLGFVILILSGVMTQLGAHFGEDALTEQTPRKVHDHVTIRYVSTRLSDNISETETLGGFLLVVGIAGLTISGFWTKRFGIRSNIRTGRNVLRRTPNHSAKKS